MGWGSSKKKYHKCTYVMFNRSIFLKESNNHQIISSFLTKLRSRFVEMLSNVLPYNIYPDILHPFQIKQAGSLCRASVNDCDLEEYCTGMSETCPEDSFKMNGIPCSYGDSYCYNGQCPTLLRHCQRLWGKGTNAYKPNILTF